MEESALTQKIFEDFQNQGPCISPTSTYPKLRYPAQGFLRESPLIVLHLASFQLCCMMIKCAFTQKSSEKLKLFSKNRKCYQTLYTIESPDNEQLFLPLHRRCCKATNHPITQNFPGMSCLQSPPPPCLLYYGSWDVLESSQPQSW